MCENKFLVFLGYNRCLNFRIQGVKIKKCWPCHKGGGVGGKNFGCVLGKGTKNLDFGFFRIFRENKEDMYENRPR